MGYLYIVWETLATRSDGRSVVNINVVFENVNFIRVTMIPMDEKVEFVVSIHKSSGNFEVSVILSYFTIYQLQWH